MHVHLFLACEYWIFLFALVLCFILAGSPIPHQDISIPSRGPKHTLDISTSSSRKRYLCDSLFKPADLVVARPDDPLDILGLPSVPYCYCSWIEHLAPIWFAVILLMYPFLIQYPHATKPNRPSMTSSPASYAFGHFLLPSASFLHKHVTKLQKTYQKKYVTPKTFCFANPFRPSARRFSSY